MTTVHVEWPRVSPECGTRVTSVMLTPDWRSRADHVYVGMPCRYTRAHGMEDYTVGSFGKPWACLNDPRGWRAAYKEYLLARVTTDEDFARSVLALHGHALVCFCKGGKRGSDPDCHADMLASFSERLYHGLRREG